MRTAGPHFNLYREAALYLSVGAALAGLLWFSPMMGLCTVALGLCELLAVECGCPRYVTLTTKEALK